MKSSSGSKKTNPNKANFKRNLAKVGHHEGFTLDKIRIPGIIYKWRQQCKVCLLCNLYNSRSYYE
jgi:hypothetical protein